MISNFCSSYSIENRKRRNKSALPTSTTQRKKSDFSCTSWVCYKPQHSHCRFRHHKQTIAAHNFPVADECMEQFFFTPSTIPLWHSITSSATPAHDSPVACLPPLQTFLHVPHTQSPLSCFRLCKIRFSPGVSLLLVYISSRHFNGHLAEPQELILCNYHMEMLIPPVSKHLGTTPAYNPEAVDT